ncbi:hypothetical protein, partial [Burkholderia pseudomallei]
AKTSTAASAHVTPAAHCPIFRIARSVIMMGLPLAFLLAHAPESRARLSAVIYGRGENVSSAKVLDQRHRCNTVLLHGFCRFRIRFRSIRDTCFRAFAP